MLTSLRHSLVFAGLLGAIACTGESPVAPDPTLRHPRADILPAGTCQVTSLANDGAGTLRALVANTSCTTINFATGLTGTITLSAPAITIDRAVTIVGPGASKVELTLEHGIPSRVFEVGPAGTATISGFTVGDIVYTQAPPRPAQPCDDVSDFTDQFTGGPVCNVGTLTLADMRFVRIDAGTIRQGIGAIYSRTSSSLTILRTEVEHVLGVNGAVEIAAGSLNMSGSTFVADSSFRLGVLVFDGGSGVVDNSTFTNNFSVDGGVITTKGLAPVTVRYSTIVANESLGLTGGIDTFFRFGTVPVTLEATIVAGNVSAFPGVSDVGLPAFYDLSTPSFVSLGHNLIGPADNVTAAIFSKPGDAVNVVDPMVFPLANNGGPTRTMGLMSSSPAVNAIPIGESDCGTQITTDQRGAARPRAGACDIGAFESGYASYQFSGFSSPVSSTMLNTANAGQAIPLKWRILDASGQPVTNLTTATLTVTTLTCPTSSDVTSVTVAGATNTAGLQNLGSGYYQLNWQTQKSWSGSCRRLQLDLGELAPRTADFQFK